MRNFLQNGKIVNLHHIGDSSSGTNLYASMRNYQGGFVFVENGSGSSITVALLQATNINGDDVKTLALTNVYVVNTLEAEAEDQDLATEVVVDAAHYSLGDGKILVIPIRPGMFDVTNNFDCIAVNRTNFSASTSAKLFLHDGPMGITDSIPHIPSAKVNNQAE